MGFHEFRQKLVYKKDIHGGLFIIANRWFASSKICSTCGTKKIYRYLCDNEHAQHTTRIVIAIKRSKESHEMGR
ncbi:zinc ribbon domain-containing protein [Alicyclobacillus tolerans]|uniref:zinc ribbon domain-containing protein n=1 Tax=Alicyclobacillus tolerans TaxID=90970 RepID=UPI000934C213